MKRGSDPALGRTPRSLRHVGLRRYAQPIGACAIGCAALAVSWRLPSVAAALLVVSSFGAGLGIGRWPVIRGADREVVPPRADDLVDRIESEGETAQADRPSDPVPEPIETDAEDDRIVVGPWQARLRSNERVAGELAHYSVFTDVLTGQMNSVVELSEETAGEILRNLTKIDGQITALLGFIQQSGSNEQVSQVVSQIESQMNGCRDLLVRLGATQGANYETYRQQRAKIVGETHRILETLDGVNRIARQTTMLSLNVSIEASRAGSAGRGFMVIGEEIRGLSTEVQHLAKEMQERVGVLNGLVTVDLRAQAEKQEHIEREALSHVADTLIALTDNLTTLLTHQRDILHKVESENESVARPIMDLMGSIQFQDIIRQQLEHMTRMAEMVREHLEGLGAALTEPGSAVEDVSLSDKLDAHFGGYVMDNQRVAHMAAKGQATAQASGGRIELF